MIWVIIVYAILKTYVVLDIYQQSHYDIKSYLKYFIKNFIYYDLCILLSSIVGIYSNLIIIKILSAIYIFIYTLFYFRLRVKLVVSKRIVRLFILVFFYLICLSLINIINFYLLIFIEFSIIPLLIFEVNLSKMINKKYIIKTKNKLNNYSGNTIVITGSYGKTSTKRLFDQVLGVYFNSISPPKSYNTPLGIARFINSKEINVYDYLILEYGASKKNDINYLCSLKEPDIAVITEIGYMHIDGFKNIENVVNEKMRLCKNAKVLILNYDNEYIRKHEFDKSKIILSYGLNHGRYTAKNIDNGCFDFYVNDKFVKHFDTNLLVEHQILNLLSVLSYIHYLNLDLDRYDKIFKSLKTENNRLQVKKIGNNVIIDDSFNSNLKGFISALKILGEYKEKKILITPGIVELGKYRNEVYEELVTHIAKNCDIAILCGYYETRQLYYMLKGYNIEVYMTSDFLEGYYLYSTISNTLDSCVLLIENDLPDIYKRR